MPFLSFCIPTFKRKKFLHSRRLLENTTFKNSIMVECKDIFFDKNGVLRNCIYGDAVIMDIQINKNIVYKCCFIHNGTIFNNWEESIKEISKFKGVLLPIDTIYKSDKVIIYTQNYCKPLENIEFSTAFDRNYNAVFYSKNTPRAFIEKLDNLPSKIEILYCGKNKLTQLNNLPTGLIELYCQENFITNLDYLPTNLKILHCYTNKLQ